MTLSFLLYGGFGLLITSVFHRRRVVAIVAGVSAIAAALLWPVRERRAAARAQRIDDAMPRWHFNEVHRIRINAPPERVFDAIHRVTASDIMLFRTLTAIRRFGRPLPDNILNAPPDEPLLDLVTRTTFVYLADDPPREVVVGTCVGTGVNAVMNFHVAGDASGSDVTTETRVYADSPAAARKFAAYWRVILPGSDIIRRMWLLAVKRRAEAS